MAASYPADTISWAQYRLDARDDDLIRVETAGRITEDRQVLACSGLLAGHELIGEIEQQKNFSEYGLLSRS